MALVLLFAGQLATIAHELAVEHVRCAEHGGVMDAAPVGPDTHASHAPTGAGSMRTTATLGDDSSARATTHGDHGHCSVHAAQQSGAALAEPTPRERALPSVVVANYDGPAHKGIALARLAPKTSPPRA